MAVHLLAFMPFGYIREEMGRIKTKLFINLHTMHLGRKSNALFLFEDEQGQAGKTFIKYSGGRFKIRALPAENKPYTVLPLPLIDA